VVAHGTSLCSDTLSPVIERAIERLPAWMRGPAQLLFDASHQYGIDRVGRMAAAVSYRMVFALAPLLIIAVSIAGVVVGGSDEAAARVVSAVHSVAGAEVADAVGGLLENVVTAANTAALIGGILLLWTASSLFLEMQMDLNDIFDTPIEAVTGIWAIVRTRLVAFLWALGFGLILVVVLLINTVWRLLDDILPEDLGSLHTAVSYLSPLVSLLLLPLVFALVFQTLTAITVPWKAIWAGGTFTAVVFIVATFLTGWYLDNFGGKSALGFAGSLVVIIFLTYLLSVVFFFGAEVTKVYAMRLENRAVTVRSAPPTDPQILVSEPAPSVPRSAFIAFLIGLIVGWWRRPR
jgi:membrane protein